MQILIFYFSKEDNTKKLAKKACQGVEQVQGVKTILGNVNEVTGKDFLYGSQDHN
jgi:flavodoxin